MALKARQNYAAVQINLLMVRTTRLNYRSYPHFHSGEGGGARVMADIVII